jgi:AraC family transcriptional regulator, transcriptional activator of pobA
MPDAKRIISEFRKATNVDSGSQVVDLDSKYFERFDFLALRLEDVYRLSRTVRSNRWSFHRIGLITSGTGEFQTGIYKIPARKNTLVIVPARMITSSKGWSSDVKGLLLLFSTASLVKKNFSSQAVHSKKILSPYIKPHVYLNDEQAAKIANILEGILREQALRINYSEEIIALKAFELIIQCERLFADNGNLSTDTSVNEMVTAFSRLLEKNFHEQHSVSFYASRLNIHPNYLNSLIKKYTEETAKEAINNRLIIEIKYLLHATSLPIKEIAARTGFEDPNYLASFFRRKEQMSPAAYRLANV